ncbi:MAG: methyltransferase domain-containing protein [Chloroflexi bacterium]|nr:MAG: methyltransferase domain-containing protein [Chloroflexota bacterium]
MKHPDHVDLLRPGIDQPGGLWADLGSGGGAFTLALADLIGPQGKIFSIDKDGRALREQQRAMRERFPAVPVDYRQADFTRPLELPPLDGLVMANALHFHRQKEGILDLVRGYLKPGGHFLLVEYNSDHGNPWVPYPISYPTWEALALRCQFIQTRRLSSNPSRFMGEIYSAMSRKRDSH